MHSEYVTDILTDAVSYSDHAGRESVNADDIRIAVDAKLNHTFTHPPSRDVSPAHNFFQFISRSKPMKLFACLRICWSYHERKTPCHCPLFPQHLEFTFLQTSFV
eukprot:c10997_g1_i1.p1 GENE.c10997_g1_i1~~c10997_g1_i1.p1  ORF type:complete len:105 (+),score=12.31 c10997_g1_i1:102-416(+)